MLGVFLKKFKLFVDFEKKSSVAFFNLANLFYEFVTKLKFFHKESRKAVTFVTTLAESYCFMAL